MRFGKDYRELTREMSDQEELLHILKTKNANRFTNDFLNYLIHTTLLNLSYRSDMKEVFLERQKKQLLNSKTIRNIFFCSSNICRYEKISKERNSNIYYFVVNFLKTVDYQKISIIEMLYVTEINKHLKLKVPEKEFEIFYKSTLEANNNLNGLLKILKFCKNEDFKPCKLFWDKVHIAMKSKEGKKLWRENMDEYYELCDEIRFNRK